MPLEHIHVLPVGFDIQRLTLPLTAGEFDADRALLLYSTDDVISTYQASQDRADELVANAVATAESILEDHARVTVERDTIPSLGTYEDLFVAAYDLLADLSDDAVVHVNLSSLPLNGASAFANAAALISAEGAQGSMNRTDDDFPREYRHRADRLRPYYIRPETYHEVELLDHLENGLPRYTDPLHEHVMDRWAGEVEADLLFELGEAIRLRVETFENELDRALDGLDPDERSESLDNDIDRCREVLNDLRMLGPPRPGGGPLRGEEGAEPTFDEDYYLQVPFDIDTYIDILWQAVGALSSETLPQDVDETMRRTLPDLDRAVKQYDALAEWSIELINWADDLYAEMWEVGDLVDRIDRTGMTYGMQEIDGEEYLSLPIPPVHELRDMERLVLSALDRTEDPQSVGELASEIATLLRDRLAQLLATDQSSESVPEFVQIVETMERDNAGVLVSLETEFEETIRSRIQYNLETLEEKQYISRKRDPADKRRTVSTLTRTGQLWIAAHDLAEQTATPLDDILANQVPEHIAEGDA